MSKQLFIATLICGLLSIANVGHAKVIDKRIYLVPAENVDRGVINALKDALPDSLPLTAKAEIDPQKKLPDSAYDFIRRQYSSETLLKDMSRGINLAKSRENAVIITDADLYSANLDFVYGNSDPSKMISIISIARLKNEFYQQKPDSRLLVQRALKEAIHELGHAWGIQHCSDQKCVMFSSKNLAEIDRKKSTFCLGCQKKLNKIFTTPLFDHSLTLL